MSLRDSDGIELISYAPVDPTAQTSDAINDDTVSTPSARYEDSLSTPRRLSTSLLPPDTDSSSSDDLHADAKGSLQKGDRAYCCTRLV
jgi:hypothetical protein